MIPHRVPFFLPWFYPSLTWRMPPGDRDLYLTFDDGPVPGPTEFVLSELAKRSLKATFFCIGDNIKKHPDIFQKVIDGRHTVGNHTFNHLNGWARRKGRYSDHVRAVGALLLQHRVPSTRLFRPPYGRIKRSQLSDLAEFRIVMWDVLSFDFEKRLSPERCLEKTLSAIRPGSIIVFHDSLKAQKNMMYAFPRLVDHCLSLGFNFKTLG